VKPSLEISEIVSPGMIPFLPNELKSSSEPMRVEVFGKKRTLKASSFWSPLHRFEQLYNSTFAAI
jgi:hypothetical protein